MATSILMLVWPVLNQYLSKGQQLSYNLGVSNYIVTQGTLLSFLSQCKYWLGVDYKYQITKLAMQ